MPQPATHPRKPLGIKNYGSIAHLPNSRMGEGDHKCPEGQASIATFKTRDKHDRVIVQEKLDGSNVGVALVNGVLCPLGRAGYLAAESPYEQHWRFAEWVFSQQDRFLAVLHEGERLCGEWLMQAHGTRYDLPHEPFVVFDLMHGSKRSTYAELSQRVSNYEFVLPRLLHEGTPFSLEAALDAIAISGHGAVDPVEGAVWRVERNVLVDPGRGGERRWDVDFLVKYVRPDKIDGSYLPGVNGHTEIIWNTSRQVAQG
ncbi:MAG: RNA ligase family protein [Thermosynechococcaceae cyanobacterium]